MWPIANCNAWDISRDRRWASTGSSVTFEIDLRDILKGVVDVFGRKLDSRSVTVQVESDGPVLLHGIPGELRQVFSNLLSNAIDASPAGSQVRIRIKNAGENVQVAVADRGSGIPEAARTQVFEPFFTTKKNVGTGLGLWISREIIQNHGGTIRFRSRSEGVRSGTVFVVTLSKKQASRTTAA